jgi:hypothetical protein
MRKPKVGEIVKVKGIPDLADKEVKVTAVALGYAWIKPYKRAREDIEVPLDLIEYIAPEEFTALEKRALIKKWVKESSLLDFKAVNKEVGVFNVLFEKYPNTEFWKQFELGFQVISLSWWVGGGKDDLRAAFNTFSLDLSSSKSNNVQTQTEKIGEDIQIKKKISYKDL